MRFIRVGATVAGAIGIAVAAATPALACATGKIELSSTCHNGSPQWQVITGGTQNGGNTMVEYSTTQGGTPSSPISVSPYWEGNATILPTNATTVYVWIVGDNTGTPSKAGTEGTYLVGTANHCKPCPSHSPTPPVSSPPVSTPASPPVSPPASPTASSSPTTSSPAPSSTPTTPPPNAHAAKPVTQVPTFTG